LGCAVEPVQRVVAAARAALAGYYTDWEGAGSVFVSIISLSTDTCDR
jgi:hypothetical protein